MATVETCNSALALFIYWSDTCALVRFNTRFRMFDGSVVQWGWWTGWFNPLMWDDYEPNSFNQRNKL